MAETERVEYWVVATGKCGQGTQDTMEYPTPEDAKAGVEYYSDNKYWDYRAVKRTITEEVLCPSKSATI